MKTISIPLFDQKTAQEAKMHLDNLAKVKGSLGVLEDLVIRLAGITANNRPAFKKKGLVLFAGDHDIALHGLSATGQEITQMQIKNFLTNGGTINTFCQSTNTSFYAVDVGMKNHVDYPHLIQRKIMNAAHDFTIEKAMSLEQTKACIQVGIDMARQLVSEGYDLLATGEMGIGNTTPSSAITAVICQETVENVTGYGSGIPPASLQKKIAFIKQALDLHKPNPNDALDILSKIGGTEIAAMTGFMLGGASLRVPVVIDGFIAGASAALAVLMQPEMKNMLIGSHTSTEQGHSSIIQHTNIPTYFDFKLRLGEGTGAVLLFPIIEAATQTLTQMKTLNELSL